MENNQILIYKSIDGKTNIEVNLENETVWLSQNQMATLFDKARTTINGHIKNIFKEGELIEEVVCRDFRHTTLHGAIIGKNQEVTTKMYNLDVIISVGYRVKSLKGTQFRIWATTILKEHLINGYSINYQKIKNEADKYLELKNTLKLIEKSLKKSNLSLIEATGLVKIISDYNYALSLLDKYDFQSIEIEEITNQNVNQITYNEAISAIEELRNNYKTEGYFGKEKDKSFSSSLTTIYQTFDGTDLYPSIEEKAANLLYFIVKNHSFSDGNKRIAAFIFIWFLDKNNILYNKFGTKRIADNALVALTLLIAESRTEEKDLIVKLVTNLINKKNI